MDIDAYDNPDAEALLRAGEERLSRQRRDRRELIVHGVGAASFVLAAAGFAALAPWRTDLSVSRLVIVLFVWVIVERVKFPVAGGWSSPEMLAFVPALFLLPTPLVPILATVPALVRRAPEVMRGRARVAILPVLIGDVWFTIGPAAVIVLAGAQRFAWSRWPVYAAAFGAMVLVDNVNTAIRYWFAEGINPRVQLPLLIWLYLTDLTLAPLGLLLAAASVERPGLLLLALAPMATLWLFARERKERLDETLALSTAYRGTALLLGDIVEADDHYTGLHSREVVDLSIAVARELGLDASRQRNVEFAALLHDVGKIRIPKEIINKSGPLNEVEWELVRRHTIDGERMLQMVGGALAHVGGVVRATHERFDGEGYPDGLAGEAIPVEARIICACDAYSAMTTDRAYRPAMTHAQALDELRRCAGSQFDPRVVAAIERTLAPRQGSWLDVLAAPGESSPDVTGPPPAAPGPPPTTPDDPRQPATEDAAAEA